LPLAITAIAWQPMVLLPGAGVDPSWQAGLEMAVHGGITFGNHLIFTYGPLGFLSVPQLWYAHLGELAFAYTVLIRLALAIALFLAARQSFGAIGAFVIAAIVASVDVQLTEMVAFLIVAVAALDRGLRGRRALALAAASGAFAGVEFLNKVSIGISLAAMTAVLVLSLSGRRERYAGAAVAGFAVALVLGWAVTGQSFGALGDYFVNSARIVSGYAAAMGMADPSFAWAHASAFLGLALGLWGAWQMTATGTRRQRLGIAGLWLAFWFFAFKEGFVREDVLHVVWFFEGLLGGFVAFRWRRGQRAAGLVGTGALLALALAAQGVTFGTDFDPPSHIKAAFDDLRSVVDEGRSKAFRVAGRAAIIATEPIDPQSLALLGGHTVAVFPQEIALAWAYRLDWDPLPVEQSYSAYTTSLDGLDAADLASRRAPERIILDPPHTELDGRLPAFDEGQTSRAILCRYRSLRATAGFDVLGLGPDRCSPPEPLATMHADWGQTVSVPAPPRGDSLVSVRIGGIGIGGFERITALLYKPDERFVSLNGAIARRLVTGTAADGLPLSASRGVDLPAPFNFARGARTIAVLRAGQGPTGGKPITYSFFVQSVTPAGRGAADRPAGGSRRGSDGARATRTSR
jgi:hypothetical protein